MKLQLMWLIHHPSIENTTSTPTRSSWNDATSCLCQLLRMRCAR